MEEQHARRHSLDSAQVSFPQFGLIKKRNGWCHRVALVKHRLFTFAFREDVCLLWPPISALHTTWQLLGRCG